MYVENVNSMTCERRKPYFSRDTEQYYHKSNVCGINYELGMNIFQDTIIWTNGPFKYGSNNDRGKLMEHGLMDKPKEIDNKSLSEKIYNGHPNEIKAFNAFDCDSVKKIKARAQMRHDKFNERMKEFRMMQVKFRSPDYGKIAATFEAIAVLVQYILEHG